jgi:ferritin-like protein
MPSASSSFHEDPAQLAETTRDLHRALVSIQEELEAIDWYAQRVEAAADPELKEVLDHNRREEIEHACMLLEWVRRRDPTFAHELERHLFRSGPIVAEEEPAGDGRRVHDLGLGNLRSPAGEKT